MKICPKCGSEFLDALNYCKHDGEPLIAKLVPLKSSSLTDEPSPSEVAFGIENKKNFFKESNMATWKQIRDYIQTNFKSEYDEEEDTFKLIFEVNNGNEQLVLVERYKNQSQDNDWIEISAPVGAVGKNDIFDLLESLSGKVCGGAVKYGENVWIRSTLQVSGVTADDINNVMWTLAGIADELNEKFA